MTNKLWKYVNSKEPVHISALCYFHLFAIYICPHRKVKFINTIVVLPTLPPYVKDAIGMVDFRGPKDCEVMLKI